MAARVLEPNIELLTAEYVLVQAWKKTSSHIRYHNWYSDTLELDRAAVNLPHFLSELAEQLKAPHLWRSDPLRIVPAPKSQPWCMRGNGKGWGPVKPTQTAARMRPLAHVSLRDQVAATAVMLCLADRVETNQGDPREPITNIQTRNRVISYGSRLFCDKTSGELRHPWGSAKLYRAYYQDYRSFLSRPEVAAEAAYGADSPTLVVHSDLDKFYDRVRPPLLSQKLSGLARADNDPSFLVLAQRVLNWRWNKKDTHEVAVYEKHAELEGFTEVALPQGLVSGGFFANVALLDFDEALRVSLFHEIAAGVRLEDACRYVDDLRIVLTVDPNKNLSEIETIVSNWIQGLLDRTALGLRPSKDKTKATTFRDDKRPIVLQSRKMARIQAGLSGGFDAIAGLEILDAVQGLIRSQQRYSEGRVENQKWPFAPVADVRDDTVARFAAGRFRRTYRSLRPLLEDREVVAAADSGNASEDNQRPARMVRTQAELDDEARAFALGLIENWLEDPSNVRLLRIGLDLWPADDILTRVLELLRPFTVNGGRRNAGKRVAWYCLAEIFRAGATETGFVENAESLPAGIDIAKYRSVLWNEAVRLASLSSSVLPWYLKQQIALFLAANEADHEESAPVISGSETKHYRELIRFLRDDGDSATGTDFVTSAILSRRAFRGCEASVQLLSRRIGPRQLAQIADRDPSFAVEILASNPDLAADLPLRIRGDLSLERPVADGWISLATVVLKNGPNGPLRNELDILWFASEFLQASAAASGAEAITPSDVLLRPGAGDDSIFRFDEIRIAPNRIESAGSMYSPPPWCPAGENWRFQLGFLLRFILTARVDFTKIVRPPHRKESRPIYRTPDTHWYQRMYGFFNGHAAFGDDWLPISDWVERLVSALLNWPGCRMPETFEWLELGINTAQSNIRRRLAECSSTNGAGSSVLKLRVSAPRLVMESSPRPMRACIMQTATPKPDDFKPGDLTLSNPSIRKRHRNHLSAALAAIERMLDLRETHKKRDGRLDWLILPELSVHPDDIHTHLVPFARAHKTIILAGLTYEELFAGQPLINSAIWVIPTLSAAHGLQIQIRRQGKYHLAPDEEIFNAAGSVLQGFRPCQWLVGYEWSHDGKDEPLWLTCSVCYDATDLRLASELRGLSDVFAIPALNKDINTFDQMAMALHYHMFQLVIVANNGLYGGSNAYAPFEGGSYVRQLFHLHGQPQAAMAFIEIDDAAGFIARKNDAKAKTPVSAAQPSGYRWKFPPAGM